MLVQIWCGDVALGTAELVNLDPPMGIASGRFTPFAAYAASEHANAIAGEYLGDRGSDFQVRSEEFGLIPHQGVSIHDCAEDLDEIELTVWGIAYPLYETIFGHNPQYSAYWSDQSG